jgi:hypothetical protein
MSAVNTVNTIHAYINAVEIPDAKTLHQHKFIMTALDKGWSIKKRNDKYILSKKHHQQKEVFMDDYLEKIMNEML